MNSSSEVTPKWPKRLSALTPEQQRISDDFMHYWHEVWPKRYSVADEFGHRYVVRHAPQSWVTTLEIGAGLGEHLRYERLTDSQYSNYWALDLRSNMAEAIRERYPGIQVEVADCQQALRFPNGYFDRILAIHVLEHLPDLPAAIRELHRVCAKPGGVLSMVIPCEGSFPYGLARRVSAQRIFERRYKQSYRWFIEREHLNRPAEIFAELRPYFTPLHRSWFPLPLPWTGCNLFIGATFGCRLTAG